MKFCRASSVGGGCGEGEVCVPRQPAAAQCALADGEVDCAGYASGETDWYTGVGDDTRSCGACSCTATGGGCDGVAVLVGTDYTCDSGPGNVADESQSCFGQTYSPPVELVGDVAQPTDCVAEAPTSGEAAPSGQQTLCCGPG